MVGLKERTVVEMALHAELGEKIDVELKANLDLVFTCLLPLRTLKGQATASLYLRTSQGICWKKRRNKRKNKGNKE